MASRIRIFDHFMKPLEEIEAPTTPRSWVLNGYGRCEFALSTSDPKCTDQILRFGNLVHIEHIPTEDQDGNINGQLPSWVGIILPQRSWDYGVVRINAYSAEAILMFRAMPHTSVQDTPRSVFKQIIDHSMSRAKNIIIQPNIMDDIPMTFADDLRTNAYDHIQKLIKDSQMDWSITGDVNSKGNLELFANLYYRKGIDTPLSLNNDNTELQSPLLTEQGTLSNQIFGYSHAQTARGRFSKEVSDHSSISDYGPFQTNQVFSGKHDPASVGYASKAMINRTGRPVMVIKRNALDIKDTFNFLEDGNSVLIKETNVGFNELGGFGFDTTAKIISMSYNDLSNKVAMNLEVFFLEEEGLGSLIDLLTDDQFFDLFDEDNQLLIDDI